jgi:transcriptional regulator with GAF, ATPase, and Fis domain
LQANLNECLGELIEKGSPGSSATAAAFFKEAARLYKKCSAQRKELSLIEKRPEYFEEEAPIYAVGFSAPALTLPNIDINYLIKSCLIIPAETEEKVLLDKIMNVVLESSGAQHGYLIMGENGDLIIRAESHITEKDVVRAANQKFEDCKDICHAIIRYVHRTKEMVLLENASEKGEFKDNPEVQEMKLKSVLCLPVIKQNKLVGILYLENRLSDSVFTAERADITNLFTYEAAVSRP